MNRRGFFASLLALPLVARAMRETERPFIVHRIDDTNPKRIAPDKLCPMGHIYVMQETALVNPSDFRRLGTPNGLFEIYGREFVCWE